ncbi:virulence RhuM family protein [Bacteroides fragilis]|nr:virulence RhuM family protein [Bacteroides fragilis]
MVQNKLHWAISRQTAVEIIVSRVDADKPNMALTTWKNAPNGMIRNPDVSIAKNYLNEMEMDDLNRIVSMYLDYAERQAKKRTSDVHERLGEKVGRIFAVQRISRPTT